MKTLILTTILLMIGCTEFESIGGPDRYTQQDENTEYVEKSVKPVLFNISGEWALEDGLPIFVDEFTVENEHKASNAYDSYMSGKVRFTGKKPVYLYTFYHDTLFVTDVGGSVVPIVR